MPAQGIGLYRDQGIVLRGIRLGEADRILTIYSRGHGRIRAVAKGVRRATSRFGARLDAFTHVDLLMYKGRSDLDVITQAEIVRRLPRLRDDYGAFCAAGAMADAVERTTPEREGNPRLFALLRGGLAALEDGAPDPALLAYAFLAKVASIGGLHPTLEICVGCGSTEREAFSFGNGGAVCRACSVRSDPVASVRTLDVWSSLLGSDWDALRTAAVEAPTQRELAGLLLGFVQWHTDGKLPAYGLLARAGRGA